MKDYVRNMWKETVIIHLKVSRNIVREAEENDENPQSRCLTCRQAIEPGPLEHQPATQRGLVAE
jgi:hypothetical protein